MYEVEGSLLVSGKGVTVDPILLPLDPSVNGEPVGTFGWLPLVAISDPESVIVSSIALLLVVLGLIDDAALEVLSVSLSSFVGVTVDSRLFDSDVGCTISVLLSEESNLFGVVGKTDCFEVERSSMPEDKVKSLVGITDGGVDDIGIEGVGRSLVPIDGPSEPPAVVDWSSLDPPLVDDSSVLVGDISLDFSDELLVTPSDLDVFDIDIVVED